MDILEQKMTAEYEKITSKDLEAGKDYSNLHLGEFRRYQYFFRHLRETEKAEKFMADRKVKQAEAAKFPKKEKVDRSHLKFSFEKPSDK